jgi:hypothetical protein
MQLIINKRNETDVDTDFLTELPDDVTFLNDTRAFRHECSRKKKPCLISFLDGRTNPSSMKQFEQNFQELDKIMLNKKSNIFTYNWINATCQVILEII